MKYISWILLAMLGLSLSFGCGGGGGAPPADVEGVIMIIDTTVQGAHPLAGATVKIGGASIVTDALGAFLLRNVPSNAATIEVTGPGVLKLTQALPPLTPNNTPQHVINNLGNIFVLNDTDPTNINYSATVSGVVVRADNLAPVSGATVTISGLRMVTGADGAFHFVGLPVGLQGKVGTVTATNFENADIVIEFPLGKSPPDNNLGNILISPPVGGIPGLPTDIKGKITLQGQADATGTLVTLLRQSDGGTVATYTTDATGNYGFFVAAGNYAIKAEHVGFQTQQVNVTLVRPDQPVIKDITLVP